MKTCTKCKVEKPVGEFSKDRSQVTELKIWCRGCCAISAKYWRDNRSPEQRIAEAVRVHARDIRRVRIHSPEEYRRKLLKKYGLTPESFARILTGQNNECAICDQLLMPGPRTHIDHNHATGKVRGLLCSNCNMALGKFQDSAGLLRKAAEYLDAANIKNKKQESIIR